jgi:hypothetical protein
MVNQNYFMELLRLVEPTSAEMPSIATSTMSTSKWTNDLKKHLDIIIITKTFRGFGVLGFRV